MSAELVILDRDGVVNADSADYIKNESEWKALPGSLEAISRLNRAGYRVVIVTNQSALGRGLMNVEQLNGIHRKLMLHLNQFGGAIDAIFFCPHTPDDQCACRKPATGLYRDIEAARAAGARPILVRTGTGRGAEQSGKVPAGVPVHDDLRAAVDALLAGDRAQAGHGTAPR